MEKVLTIRELREKAGLRQQELAALAGITQPILSHIETGGRPCPLKVAGSMAPHLRVSVEDVLRGSEQAMLDRAELLDKQLDEMNTRYSALMKGPHFGTDDAQVERLSMEIGSTEADIRRLRSFIHLSRRDREPRPAPYRSDRPDRVAAAVAASVQDQIPVHSIAKAGPGQPMFLDDGPIEWTDRPGFLARVQDAYAVYVSGESMYPRYRSGQVLYVHPHRPPTPGMGVVVVTSDNDVLIKEWVREDLAAVFLKEYRPKEREFELPRNQIATVHTVVGLKEA